MKARPRKSGANTSERTDIRTIARAANVSIATVSGTIRSRTFASSFRDHQSFVSGVDPGIEDIAVEHGYEILVSSTSRICIRRMLERKVEGVAVMTLGVEDLLLNQMAKRKVPLVFIECDSARDAFIGMEEVIRPRAVIAIGSDKRSSVYPITL